MPFMLKLMSAEILWRSGMETPQPIFCKMGIMDQLVGKFHHQAGFFCVTLLTLWHEFVLMSSIHFATLSNTLCIYSRPGQGDPKDAILSSPGEYSGLL
jgi:hypothetical protein